MVLWLGVGMLLAGVALAGAGTALMLAGRAAPRAPRRRPPSRERSRTAPPEPRQRGAPARPGAGRGASRAGHQKTAPRSTGAPAAAPARAGERLDPQPEPTAGPGHTDQGDSDAPAQALPQSRRPHGPLERRPPQDGHLRMAGLRARRVRHRHRLADARHRPEGRGRRRAGPRQHPHRPGLRPRRDRPGRVRPDPSDARTIDDPAFRATIDETIHELSAFPQVEDLHSPPDRRQRGPDLARPPRGDGLVHPARHLRRGDRPTSTRSSPAWTPCRRRTPTSTSPSAGISTDKALDALFDSQLARAGLIAIPLTIFILLLVTGSLMGALVPGPARPDGRASRPSASFHCRASSCRWTRRSAR